MLKSLNSDIICEGGAEGGEIQHSETRLFLFGINFRSVTQQPKAQGLLVFLGYSFSLLTFSLTFILNSTQASSKLHEAARLLA